MHQSTPEETLRFHGLRATPGRKAVLEVLLAADRPLTHHEITGRLDPGAMDRVSVAGGISG